MSSKNIVVAQAYATSRQSVEDSVRNNVERRREPVSNFRKSSIPVIPKKSNSKTGNDDMDWNLYKYRHLIENIFARLKHFRAIATRYDKLKRNHASMVAFACGYLWLPM